MGTWDGGVLECEQKIIKPLIAKGQRKGLEISLTTKCEQIVDFIMSATPDNPGGTLPIAIDDKNQQYHLQVQYRYPEDYSKREEFWIITQDAFVFMTFDYRFTQIL